jgi:hypothetical protein
MNSFRGLHTWLILAPCLFLSACITTPFVITPAELTNAVLGQAYSVTLDAEGAPATWALVDGSLPPGLTLNEGSGLISGTPTVVGSFTFTVSANDPRLPPRSGEQTYTLTVLPALQVQFAPTAARVSIPYSYTPTISGGVPPYAVQIVGLPQFLGFDSTTGQISGTLQPIANFVYPNAHLTWVVIDSGVPQQQQTGSATLVINPLPVSIVTTTLTPATIGTPYALAVVATNGLQPYAWALTSGALPSGLQLNAQTGLISGTLGRDAQTQMFQVAVTDGEVPPTSDQRTFKLIVNVVIATTSLPAATIGVPYQTTASAVGGLPPYGWLVSDGTLPAGLTLDTATGAITGTPTAGATSQTFILRVIDSDLPASSFEQQLTIQVH